MDNKIIKKRRMMSYFIEAAQEIIENDGIEHVTIRNVAKLAGYNSATLYNYFENLNHLIFFASMKYVKDYLVELPYYIKDCDNSLDKFIKIWECFCYRSFSTPKIYNAIFFGDFTASSDNSIKEYYSIFPEEMDKLPKSLKEMITTGNLYDRDKVILKDCVEEGYILDEDFEEINEMILLIYEGMISRLLSKKSEYSSVEAAKHTIKFIEQTLKSYKIK